MPYEAGMAAARKQDRPRFLIATDLSAESVPHLQFAVRLAAAFGAHPTLFHAVLPRALIVDAATSPTETRVDDPETSRRLLQQLGARLGGPPTVHVATSEARDAVQATLVAAERVDAAMIVLPTHGRTGLERAVLGSTAEQILRRSHRPVLLLTDRMLACEAPAADDRRPVLVATDLSATSIAAHRAAAELAHRLGRALVLVSVQPAREPPAYGGGAAAAPPPGDPQARAREHAAVLRKHAAEIAHDRPADVLALVDDDVPGAIVRAAREQSAGLLVLATHGRRGMVRLLKGSVAEQVVRHATVPVVCLPRPAE